MTTVRFHLGDDSVNDLPRLTWLVTYPLFPTLVRHPMFMLQPELFAP